MFECNKVTATSVITDKFVYDNFNVLTERKSRQRDVVLGYIVVSMSKYPDILDRIKEEVDAMVESCDDVKKKKYTVYLEPSSKLKAQPDLFHRLEVHITYGKVETEEEALVRLKAKCFELKEKLRNEL